MNDTKRTDGHIAALIEAYADRAPTDVDPVVMTRWAVAHSARSALLDRLFRGRRAQTGSGRANPMQPLLKIGAAVATVVVVVAAAALATRPSTTPGTTSTHVAEAPPGAAPVEFTGLWRCGPSVRSVTTETLDVGADGGTVTRNRDGAWVQSADMTDARLEGTIHHTWESDAYAGPGAAPGPQVAAWTYRIENDQGAWVAHGTQGTFADGTTVGESANVLIGEGGYAGLFAIFEVTAQVGSCDNEVRGIIFDGVPAPQPFVPALPG